MPKKSNLPSSSNPKHQTSTDDTAADKGGKGDVLYSKLIRNAVAISKGESRNAQSKHSKSKDEKGENISSKSGQQKSGQGSKGKVIEMKLKPGTVKSPKNSKAGSTGRSLSKDKKSVGKDIAPEKRGKSKSKSIKKETKKDASKSKETKKSKVSSEKIKKEEDIKEEKKLKPKHKKAVERSRSKSAKKEESKKQSKKPTKKQIPKELSDESNTSKKPGYKTPGKTGGDGKRSRSSSKSRSRSTPLSHSKSSSPQAMSRSTSVKRATDVANIKPGTLKGAKKKPISKERKPLKNVKEFSSENLESSSSIDLSYEQKKHKSNFSYQMDSHGSKKVVDEVIEDIAKKATRKKNKEQFLTKKRKRGDVKAKEEAHTAQEFDYLLQRNPNSKAKPIINLEDLANHKAINYSDVLLALIEVANSNNYIFAYSSKSKSFWSDILQYTCLKKIFADFKAETLRKYWTELSKYDSESSTDLIKKNKKYLDNLPLKLGTIVTSISKFLGGKIKNFQDYINTIQLDIRKKEIFEHEYKDPITGEVTKIKDVRTIYNTKRKYEPGKEKNFKGSDLDVVALEEVYEKRTLKTGYQNVMQYIMDDNINRFAYLNQANEEEKRKLMKINEDDKFIFKSVDYVLDGLCREFNGYTREYILDTLMQNSMDIAKTYISLKEPKKAKDLGYSPLDDKVLLKKNEGEEYKNLVSEKGKASIEERERYLTGL